MRRLWWLLTLVFGMWGWGCGKVLAGPSSIWWPGWTISSSEELSQGIKYSHNSVTPQYPLTLMFDNDPATAWVFSSRSKEWDNDVFQGRYGVMLTPSHPIMVDGLRMMNGQNQSRRRFLQNDRVLQIRVTMDIGGSKVVRTFALADRTGWQSVSLPRNSVKDLKVEFTGVRRGKGPHNDLCISELALFDRGQKVDLHMPLAVMYYDGLEGEDPFYLITRQGKMLDGLATDFGDSDHWSPSGRYVSGVSGPVGRLWIADTWEGRMISHIKAINGHHLSRADRKWWATMLATNTKF